MIVNYLPKLRAKIVQAPTLNKGDGEENMVLNPEAGR